MRNRVALLRGINVGGNRKVPMADLRDALSDFDAVKTYIQSGNIAFRSDESPERLQVTLAERISDRFDFEVPVVVRTGEALRSIVAANPFVAEAEADPRFVHVGFLHDDPVGALDPERSPHDRFELHGRNLYIHYGRGSARSKLTVAYVDRTVGTTMTGRNWRTVNKLLGLLDG